MTQDDFLDKQYELSVVAGMNQRYHQRYATFWWRIDTAAKIITAILAVIGAMLAVAATFKEHPESIDRWAVTIASLAAVAAVILNVIPFGTWEKEHRDFLRQWTDLRLDTEAILGECDGEPEHHHACEIRRIDAKRHGICGEEPMPNAKVLKECLKAEKESRTPPPQPPDRPPQQTPAAVATASPIAH